MSAGTPIPSGKDIVKELSGLQRLLTPELFSTRTFQMYVEPDFSVPAGMASEVVG